MDSNRLSKAIVSLVELIARLRGPNGCPWDAKQRDFEIKTYLIEEAYEVIEAIESANSQEVCEELGDLIFQIFFLAQLATERNEFDITAVLEKITEKMIHRHPHVFGQTKVNNDEDVALNWAEIKLAERGSSNDNSSLFQSIPVSLPALLRAHRLSERASKAGFDWLNEDEIYDRVQKQFDELKIAIDTQDKELFCKEMGDLLFSLANLGRNWGLNAEHLLRDANKRFLEHFRKKDKD
ncbi:MAG: nucleoside triphosphate pyrophosphohydrolase [Desulfobacteraceae bacterium]|nr:nucleoside triphosphate pyrophosphohydrolase [Desulfobacteraceae bacterium]